MEPAVSVAVEGTVDDELLLGKSSWNGEEASLKYGWLDKKGRRSRGGELPVRAIPQGVLLAANEGYLSREEMARIARGLVDALAAS
jgi:hypothetical protein